MGPQSSDLHAFYVESMLATWASDTGKPTIKSAIPKSNFYEHQKGNLRFLKRISKPSAVCKCDGSVSISAGTTALWMMNFSGTCSQDAILLLQAFHRLGMKDNRFLFGHPYTRLIHDEFQYCNRPKRDSDFSRFEGSESIYREGEKILYFKYEGRYNVSRLNKFMMSA